MRSDKFLDKKFHNSLKTGPNFFLQHLKNKIIYNFVKFMATKKGLTTNNVSTLSFVAVFGSGIWDPGSEIRDPKVKIRIRDPQHWLSDKVTAIGISDYHIYRTSTIGLATLDFR